MQATLDGQLTKSNTYMHRHCDCIIAVERSIAPNIVINNAAFLLSFTIIRLILEYMSNYCPHQLLPSLPLQFVCLRSYS